MDVAGIESRAIVARCMVWCRENNEYESIRTESLLRQRSLVDGCVCQSTHPSHCQSIADDIDTLKASRRPNRGLYLYTQYDLNALYFQKQGKRGSQSLCLYAHDANAHSFRVQTQLWLALCLENESEFTRRVTLMFESTHRRLHACALVAHTAVRGATLRRTLRCFNVAACITCTNTRPPIP